MAMRVATCNSQNNPDLSRKDVTKVARIAGNKADIIGFQEVHENQDVFDTEKGLQKSGKEFELLVNEISNPIAMNLKLYRPIQGGFEELNNNIPDVTPRRTVAWVLFEFVRRPELQPVAITNGHPINKGFDNRDKSWDEMARGKEIEQERWEIWRESWKIWQGLVKDLHTKYHCPVLCVGDFNNLKVPKFTKTMQWWDDKGIDKIGYIPHSGANVRMTLDWKAEFNTPSDHHLNVVRANVIKKK